MANRQYTSMAVDLGASSGRVVAGLFDGKTLRLEDVHRFPNGGIRVAGRLHWDVLGLWNEILEGLRQASLRYGDEVASVGVDTWGVDFGLLGRDQLLLGNPFHYRDSHTENVMEQAFAVVPREEIFSATGLQFLTFNTLFQLIAMKNDRSVALDAAEHLLMMPDLFHWLLTGELSNEATDASTTQFLDPRTKQWSRDLLARFDLPHHFLGEITPPGTILGGLRSEVIQATGLNGVQVVLPGSHDTASAVMAVPAKSSDRPDWCYISSGTWSLMGVETPAPIINDRTSELNFTNEGGVGGTTRFLKNIAGLWLVQECRRVWDLEGDALSWEQLVQRADAAASFGSLINPDAPEFLAPDHMPSAIQEFCRRHRQPVPESPGAIIRCALESLALRYRVVFGWLEELVGHRIETIHIVGGGTRNQLLCQMTANACQRPVVAGPVEATALGNVLMQVIAMKHLDSIEQARAVIRDSFSFDHFEPQEGAAWDDAFARYTELVGP